MRRPLSPQLLVILKLMAEGWTNKNIAEQMGLSPHTVANHNDSLFRRLGARHRAHAVAIGFREGVLR